VQWHPERKSPNDTSEKIIEAFRDRELFWK